MSVPHVVAQQAVHRIILGRQKSPSPEGLFSCLVG
jgi:hypothetical protein